MRLSNKTAIVTGARRGIGRAIAIAMAKEGANVVVADLSQEDCQQVVNEIEGLSSKGLALKCDVSVRTEVIDMVTRTVAKFGTVDILVNNAAFANFKPFLRLTDEDWDTTLNINLKGPFLCAQVTAKHMIKNKWGRIINIASISSGGSGIAFPLMAHYTASKGGVVALTKAMALELAPYGINVNAICPGSIDTDVMIEPIRQRSIPRIPKGRLGKPEEVADLAVFLASDESEYITGTTMVIDGGWLTS